MGYTTIEEILGTLKDEHISFTIKERIENNDITKNDDKIIEKNPSTEEKLEPSALKEKKNISQSEIGKTKKEISQSEISKMEKAISQSDVKKMSPLNEKVTWKDIVMRGIEREKNNGETTVVQGLFLRE